MVNHSLMEPIPIEYNTCILHVLEAYHDIRQQLNMKQDTIEELNQANTNNISDFEAQLTRWENKGLFDSIIKGLPSMTPLSESSAGCHPSELQAD